ncbi:MAG: pilus assembly protein N-terminal domain-containing protein [Oligoflexia bacterium]|nr:pilus assembly protein N-terminal domain-containing protein [Oligoflexia bacterium]
MKQKHILQLKPKNKFVLIILPTMLSLLLLTLFAATVTTMTAVLAADSSKASNDAGDDSSGVVEDEAVEKEIEIAIGQDKFFKLNFVPSTKVLIGNSQILDYQLIPSRKEVMFKGLKPGDTTAKIFNTVGERKAEFKVKVTTNPQSIVVQELKEFLGDIEGLVIGVKGGRVCLEGELVVPSDIGKIAVVLEGDRYKDVLQLFELSPHSERMIVEKMLNELRKFGLKDVNVRIVNRVYWLEGMVSKEDDKALAQRIVAGYVPDRIQALSQRGNRMQSVQRNTIENFITVNDQQKDNKPKEPPPKMIKIIAQFVELTKGYNKTFGFKWTPSMTTGGGQISFGKTTSGGVSSESNGTFSGTIGNLFPQLASAKSAGYARVIQQGMIIVKDKLNKAVTLNKDDNVAVVFGTGEFQKPVNVKVGFNLSVQVRITGPKNDKVELALSVGVSTPHGTNGSISNKLDTTVIVNSGEAAVLGGMTINETQTHYDKDPPFGTDTVQQQKGDGGDGGGGGQSSPLFSFLRSKSYVLNKTQFVVFVTPEIIESPTEITNEIKRKFKQRKK